MEVFRPLKFDKPLFAISLVLLTFGMIMVFSSTAVMAGERFNQPFYFLIHQALGITFGIAVLFSMVFIRKPFYEDRSFITLFLGLTLFLLALCLLLPSYGGAKRWVQFFGLRFQPSELAKISLVLYLAGHLSRQKDNLNRIRHLIVPLVILFVFLILIIKEPDYGTAFLLFIVGVITLFVGGVKIRHFLLLGSISTIFFVFYLFQAQYRTNRIFAFISPEKDSLGSGFQIIQSKLAVGSGGLIGVSIGESTQKLFFLPCAHTDYIFAIIGEELGFVGTMAVLILFVLFLWRGLLISWRSPNLFCQIAAAGITLAIFMQALLNISIVLGICPPTGFPLPMISFGRSSMVSTLIGVGILLHISQRKVNVKK